MVPTETRNSQTFNGFTATQAYTYDALNRLKSAEETIPSQTGWNQTFDYDRFGNRTFNESNTTASANFPKTCGTTLSPTMCAADKKIFNPQAQTLNNKFSTADGYQYDNVGNTTRDAQSRKFTYDAENKQTKVETVDSNGNVVATLGEYFYDGDGKRVKKYVPGTGETTVFIYDASGKLVAENSTLPSPTQTVSYLTNDHLGSARINTDQNGNVTARHDYQPFGEEITRASYGADTNRKQFTGYERDKEIEEDFAQARYYNYKLGRFNSVDPLMASADNTNPQTFNRYVYVGNNPIIITDPTGELWGVSGTTIQWFDTEAEMKEKGFDLYKALVAYRPGTNQLVVLSETSATAVNVANGVEALKALVTAGVSTGAIVASAEALGIALSGAGLGAANVAGGIGAGFNQMQQGSYWAEGILDIPGAREFRLNLESQILQMAGTGSSDSSPTNTQGETSPADPNSVKPNPDDNKPVYEPNPKHGKTDKGKVSREPSDGSGVLENAVEVNGKTRIGVDKVNKEIVVFRNHLGNRYHGYVSSWTKLPNGMKAILRREGLVTKKGIIK